MFKINNNHLLDIFNSFRLQRISRIFDELYYAYNIQIE